MNTPTTPQTCDLIIKNGFVITVDPERHVYRSGALAILGNEIAAVGTEKEVLGAWRADRTVDAHGGIIHPGFIDPHVHIVHGSCRGIFGTTATPTATPVSFADWKADVTPDDEHIATQLAALEMLRNGFTCFVEPGTVFDGDAVASAAEAAGATVVEAHFHEFKPIGVSGFVVITESHLAIHTWPEHHYAAVDIFTCGQVLQPERAAQELVKRLECKSSTMFEVKRGFVLPPDNEIGSQ